MTTNPPGRIAPLLGALSVLWPAAAGAQSGGVDFTYGRWWHADASATTYSAGLQRRLLGPIGWGLAFTHLDDHRAGLTDRTATGGELALTVGRDGSGLYALGGVGAAVVHDGNALDGWWTVGGGWSYRFFNAVSLGLDARYRWEDRGFRGFWRLDAADRDGLQLAARLAIAVPGNGPVHRAAPRAGSGAGTRGGGGTNGAPGFRAPTTTEINEAARAGGASEIAARATTTVVETALRVMGSPYTWGGTDDNGFDCSGLIQYAYREVGIILPRVSRDQLRMGTAVDPRLDAVRPGDLLGFAVEGGQISHIGLYVGDGRFIHSASGGVRLSSLEAGDADSRWWQRRWVSARRIIE